MNIIGVQGVSIRTKEEEDAVVVSTIFGLFFWLLLVGLLITVAVRYLV